MTSHTSISPLSPTTICNLSKSCFMWSPWHCVKELVCNSVEAGATSVAVRLALNSRNIKIQVLDDGRGISRDDLILVGRQFWTSKVEGRGEALAKVSKVSKLVTMSSKTERGKTWRTQFVKGRRGKVEMEDVRRKSCGTTVTVSGFLWNQDIRRKMVREVVDVIEIKYNLIAFALIYPMVKFILTQDTEGTRKTMLNTQRGNSPIEVFCGVYGLNDGVLKEVQVEDTDSRISISGFLCLDPHHTKDLQFISVNKQVISPSELHREVQDLFRKAKAFQDWKSSVKRYAVFALLMELPPSDCFLLSEDISVLVMFRHKAMVMDMLTTTVQKFLFDHGLVSTPPSPPSSPSSVSQLMSGVKCLPPTQTIPSTIPISTKQSQFTFSPPNHKGRTSLPMYRTNKPSEDNSDIRITTCHIAGQEGEDFLEEDLENNRSFQEIFEDMDSEEENLNECTISLGGEGDNDESGGHEVIPHVLQKDLSPLIWSNHNFFFHKSPQPLVITRCKEAGLKLEHSMVRELQLIGQVEFKYMATMSGTQLMMWDQHAVHERIRLEEMVTSSLSPENCNHLKSEVLEDFLLVSLPSEEEVLAVCSRPDYSARWGLGLVRTEDTNSIIIMDIPSCLLTLHTSLQVELCQAILLELSTIILSKATLPTFPRVIMDHLATQACRGAIMFGQPLTEARCSQLILDLAQCDLPFQCAHGRPSVAMLCETDIVREVGLSVSRKINWKKFKSKYLEKKCCSKAVNAQESK